MTTNEEDLTRIQFVCVLTGNESVLRYYFQDVGPTLIFDESLESNFEVSSSSRAWDLSLSGNQYYFTNY